MEEGTELMEGARGSGPRTGVAVGTWRGVWRGGELGREAKLLGVVGRRRELSSRRRLALTFREPPVWHWRAQSLDLRQAGWAGLDPGIAAARSSPGSECGP